MPPALWGFGRGVRLSEIGIELPAQSLCQRMGVGHGRNEYRGCRGRGLLAGDRAALATGGKRGLCRLEAGRGNGHHWDGGSAATAS